MNWNQWRIAFHYFINWTGRTLKWNHNKILMKNQIIAHFALNLGTLINKIDMHAIISTLPDNVKTYVMVHCLNRTLCLLAIDMSLSLIVCLYHQELREERRVIQYPYSTQTAQLISKEPIWRKTGWCNSFFSTVLAYKWGKNKHWMGKKIRETLWNSLIVSGDPPLRLR